MNEQRKTGNKWIAGSEVKGSVSISQFPLNFTLLNHAGVSGLIFVVIWVASYSSLWTAYNYVIFGVVACLFLFMAILSPQIANNISSGKLTLRRVGRNFDWLHYARSWMALLLSIFCVNCSLLIWATGGLASPFIPFYIMVFLLALNYCRFPHPATGLTLSFVALFLTAIVLSEVRWVHAFVPAPIDDKTQTAINSQYGKKLFDAGFMTASMLVPLISMWVAWLRTGGNGLPAAAEAVTAPPVTDSAPAVTDAPASQIMSRERDAPQDRGSTATGLGPPLGPTPDAR